MNWNEREKLEIAEQVKGERRRACALTQGGAVFASLGELRDRRRCVLGGAGVRMDEADR